MTIPELVDAVLREASLTQRELAFACDVDERTIRNWLSGASVPPRAKREALLTLFRLFVGDTPELDLSRPRDRRPVPDHGRGGPVLDPDFARILAELERET